MYECLYVWMFVCMFVCLFVCMFGCLYVCVCVCVRTLVYLISKQGAQETRVHLARNAGGGVVDGVDKGGAGVSQRQEVCTDRVPAHADHVPACVYIDIHIYTHTHTHIYMCICIAGPGDGLRGNDCGGDVEVHAVVESLDLYMFMHEYWCMCDYIFAHAPVYT